MNEQLIKIQEEQQKIDKEINILTHKRNKLEKNRIDLIKQEAQKNINRCFKKLNRNNNYDYCIIIDVPQEQQNRTGDYIFNEYNFPCLWVNNEEECFKLDSLFIKEGYNLFPQPEECTYEEFMKIFDEKVLKLRQKIEKQ